MRQHTPRRHKLAAHVRYVRMRDGVFQYERRVPARVQRDRDRFQQSFGARPLFRRSLRTKDTVAMFDAARMAHSEFEALIADPCAKKERPRALERVLSRQVTNEDLAFVADRYASLTAAPFERLYRLADGNPHAATELERMEYELERNAEDIQASLRARNDDRSSSINRPATEALHIVAENGFAAPAGSEELGAIIGAVRSGMERGYRRIGSLMTGEASPSMPVARSEASNEPRLTLADAVDEYLATRQPAAKTVSETRLSLRQFESVVGRKSLSATTREDAHLFVRYLASRTVGGKTPGSIVRNLSEQSISKRLRMLGSAIYHVRDTGQFKGDNPLANIRLQNFVSAKDRSIMPDKRRFQVSELNAIFAHPWFTGCRSRSETHLSGDYRLTGAEYWVPVIAAFTGCRAAELGGMKLAEVRLDDDLPHFIVRPNEYRGTKNGRSRCIPILDALIELGFASYLDRIRSSGAVRLFPDWKAIKPAGGGDTAFPAWSNARVIRAFNRTVVPAALGDRLSRDARREVTFHGFRGAFKALIGTTNNLPMNVVHEVVGHAKSDLDARYIGEVTIEETYPLVRALRYSGLVIPAPCIGRSGGKGGS